MALDNNSDSTYEIADGRRKLLVSDKRLEDLLIQVLDELKLLNLKITEMGDIDIDIEDLDR